MKKKTIIIVGAGTHLAEVVATLGQEDFNVCQVPSELPEEQEDIHTIFATQLYNVAYEDVTPEMRAKAKRNAYGKLYGASDVILESTFEVTEKESYKDEPVLLHDEFQKKSGKHMGKRHRHKNKFNY